MERNQAEEMGRAAEQARPDRKLSGPDFNRFLEFWKSSRRPEGMERSLPCCSLSASRGPLSRIRASTRRLAPGGVGRQEAGAFRPARCISLRAFSNQ